MVFSKHICLPALLVSAVALTACSSTTPQECDPRLDPGFLQKIGCVVSGSYQERLEQKKQVIADLKEENAQLNELIRSLQDQQFLLQNDMQKRQRELDRLSDVISSVEEKLQSKQAMTREREAALRKVQQEIAQLKMVDIKKLEEQTLLEKRIKIQELEQELYELRQVVSESY